MATCLKHSQSYSPTLGEHCIYCGPPKGAFEVRTSPWAFEGKPPKETSKTICSDPTVPYGVCGFYKTTGHCGLSGDCDNKREIK